MKTFDFSRRKKTGSTVSTEPATTGPEAVPDYADVDPAGELAEVKRRWRENLKKQITRYDSEHWFCVTFASREEKRDALRELGLTSLGDKYIDGREFIRRLRAWRDKGRR